MSSAVCKNIAMISNAGVAAFPNLTPQGGTIQGVPVVVSDAVPTNQIVCVDASGIGANQGEVSLQEVDQGTLQLDSAPASPPDASAIYVSLWQMNLVGLRVERFFVGAKLRSDAAAVIQGSYVGLGSPP